MLAGLALVVAVLQQGGVVAVELPSGSEVGRWGVRGEAAGVFVAPDGVLWVPLASADATVVIPPRQEARTLPGRLAPLFFREPDRLYAVFSGQLVALAYPERVPIAVWPLPPDLGVRFAACSDDGRVVALLDGSAPPRVLLVFPFDEGRVTTVALAGWPEARRLALSPSFVAVGGGSRVGFWPLGAAEGAFLALPGEVVDLGWSSDGRELLVLLAAPRSQLWRIPVPKKLSRPSVGKALWRGEGEPRALGVSDAGFVVLETERLFLIGKGGRVLGESPVHGGRAIGVVPPRLVSGSVPWSDRQP